MDFTPINTLVRAQYDKDGVLSYKLSLKTTVTAESRSKLRTYDSQNIYGRYFKLVIEKANNATVDSTRSLAKCYLPYSFKAEVVTGNTQDTAERFGEPYAYIKYYGNPQYQYNSGTGGLDGKSTWYTWKNGMTFNNDMSREWVNVFINQGLADAYGTFFIKRVYDPDTAWMAWRMVSDSNMFFHYGNGELIEKYKSDYNKDKNCEGLVLYLETTPQEAEDVSAWYSPVPDWEPRGDKLTPYAMKKILVDRENPYDDDDHEREIYADEVSIKDETKKITFIQAENSWYANKNSYITTGATKILPYNGTLDTGFAVYNNNKEYDRQVKEIYQYLFLVDSTVPEITGEFIDDSELKNTGMLRIYIRFNEPVMMARTREIMPVSFNNGTNTYNAHYVEGNYTDTLVFEVEPPKENLRDVKYQFPSDNIGDLAYNLDEFKVVKNNRLPRDVTNKDRTLTFLNGAVNLLKPTLAIDQTSSAPSSNPHNIYNILLSINNNGQKELKECTLYYTFDNNEELLKEDGTAYDTSELTNGEIYKNSHVFTPEENGSLTLTLVKNEAEGVDSGVYYLHAYAVSGYGLTDVQTFGPYNLDGDPPMANQMHPDPNDLTSKGFILDLTNKTTGVMNIFVKFKYTDKDGKVQEKMVQIIKNGEKEPSISDRVEITPGETNTIYKYNSNINDEFLTQILTENNTSRMEFEVTFYIEDLAGNKTTTNMIKAERLASAKTTVDLAATAILKVVFGSSTQAT